MKPYINQNKIIRLPFFVLVLTILFFTLHCSSTSTQNSGNNSGDDQDSFTFSGSSFNVVGSALPSNDLIDLEFLPSQNGELIVIGQGGGVYYLRNNFTPLSQSESLSVEYSGEQGLLNVAADPDYASNHYVYFYYTVAGGGINRVSRATVAVDVNAGTFSLSDFQTIIDFDKSDSSSPGDNHNGGGLIFENSDNLLIAVGDGGGSASSDTGEAISQNGLTRLGKILRVVPGRQVGVGGYSIPSGGNNSGTNLDEIYALGLRNPFTMTYASSLLFIGDVGGNLYEEINLATEAAMNFAWPLEEGFESGSSFDNPLHGYAHTDDSFTNEDTQAHSSESTSMIRQYHNGVDHGDSSKSVMVLHYYTGNEYHDFLSNRLIYADFYLGWVRALQLNDSHQVVDDDHIGHLTGLTSLQQGPDGLLYGVSLYGSDQVLRLDFN